MISGDREVNSSGRLGTHSEDPGSAGAVKATVPEDKRKGRNRTLGAHVIAHTAPLASRVYRTVSKT